MGLETTYPKLMAKITDPVYEIRDLVVVDENYDDIDSEELDVFEPDEYNFLVYVTPRVQEAVGEKNMQRLIQMLGAHEKFGNFFAPEIDMYGLQSDMDEEAIAHEIVSLIDRELVC
ncbi:MAG: hypothetical protein DSZ05_03735 [Sulfurospirillum sp.]|nr:MAG: hypothetical protein DSZ05_03735 [Sulfurospirillum sp.]